MNVAFKKSGIVCALVLMLSACGGDPDIKAGDDWIKAGDFVQAEQSYRQSIEKKPASLPAREKLIELYLSSEYGGDIRSALNELETIKKLQGDKFSIDKYSPKIRKVIILKLENNSSSALGYAKSFSDASLVKPLEEFVRRKYKESRLDQREFVNWHNAYRLSSKDEKQANNRLREINIETRSEKLNYFTALLAFDNSQEMKSKIVSLYSTAFEEKWKTFNPEGNIPRLLKFERPKPMI